MNDDDRAIRAAADLARAAELMAESDALKRQGFSGGDAATLELLEALHAEGHHELAGRLAAARAAEAAADRLLADVRDRATAGVLDYHGFDAAREALDAAADQRDRVMADVDALRRT